MILKRVHSACAVFLYLMLSSLFAPTLNLSAAENFESLYEEIEAANSRGSGAITLSTDIVLSAPLPPITGEVEIDGQGHSLSGANAYRIFVVDGGNLNLRNITIREGSSSRDGGAILIQNDGSLIVDSARFTKNTSEQGGGAISTSPSDVRLEVSNSAFDNNAADSGGGAILVIGGTAEVTSSSFRDNYARRFGGAIQSHSGTVNIENSTFFHNEALEAGGIYASGARTTLTHLTMLDNVAGDAGDSIVKRGGAVTLRNSIVAGRSVTLDCIGGLDDSRGNFSQDGSCAPVPGGDPLLAELTGSPAYFPLLDGSPAVDAAVAEYCLERDQAGVRRPVGGGCDVGAHESLTASPAEISASASDVCTLSDNILAANSNTAVGGCPAGSSHDIISLTEDIILSERLPLFNGTITIEGNGHSISGDGRFPLFVVTGRKLTIRNLTLTDGFSGEDGGAILVQTGAELVIENATFTRNRSEKGGGAIATAPSNVRMSVSNSSFEGNSAASGGGGILVNGGTVDISGSTFKDNSAGRFGGGLEAFVGRVNVSNSTFVGNQGGEAGGILVSGARTTMTHLTLQDNVALWGQADGIFRRDGSASLRNSIVAGDGSGSDCAGGLNETSGNLSQDGSCALLPSGNPLLGELTGSPGYLPLLDGSPAVDAAAAEFCLETDQLGQARPLGGGCDIGAVESATAAAPEASAAPTECTLYYQILAANTNTAVGGCTAGTSHDIISLTEDITLSEPLPSINGTITIEGNGHTISGGNQVRIFVVNGRKLTINNLTLARGSAEGVGAAILVQNNAELVVNDSTFEHNSVNYVEIGEDRITGGYGGAIGTQRFNGKISVNNSVLKSNNAQLGGGAMYVNGGTANISGSTFSSNNGQGFGGAIEVAAGQVTIENSTFQRNRSSNGGVISIGGGTVTMTHLTMLDNSSSYGDGDAIWQWRGSADLRNSVVAGRGRRPDCHGNISLSGNFSQDGTCGSLTGDDPMLGEMTGVPGYFPPLEKSPVVDAADSAFCLAVDQAGKPRPIGAGCDIGAIEWGIISEAQAASVASEADSSACNVTTTHVLNFRDGPNGNRIGLVPTNTTVTVSAQESGWINVEYRGVSGWISADYVTMAGDCG